MRTVMSVPSHVEKPLGHSEEHMLSSLSHLPFTLYMFLSFWLAFYGRGKVAAQKSHVPVLQFQIHREIHSLTNQRLRKRTLRMVGSDSLPSSNLLFPRGTITLCEEGYKEALLMDMRKG